MNPNDFTLGRYLGLPNQELERNKQQKLEEIKKHKSKDISAYESPAASISNISSNPPNLSKNNYWATNSMQNQAKKSSASINNEIKAPINSKTLPQNQVSAARISQNQANNHTVQKNKFINSTSVSNNYPSADISTNQTLRASAPSFTQRYEQQYTTQPEDWPTNFTLNCKPGYSYVRDEFYQSLSKALSQSSSSYDADHYYPPSNLNSDIRSKNHLSYSPERDSSIYNSRGPSRGNINLYQSLIPCDNDSQFSDSSSDSSSEASPQSNFYSEFMDFILSYNLYKPIDKNFTIPSSFQDSASYSSYFERGFYIEMNAIIGKALGEAFLSYKYRLNLDIKESFATISASSSNEMKFENEIQINDIVIIIPNQNNLPSSFEEVKYGNILWTLGLINKSYGDKFHILLDTNRDIQFKNSRKYIVAIIGNITSLKREFLVLDKVERFSMLDQILCPRVSESYYENNVDIKLEEILNKKHNKSQIEAIISSINSPGKISLIQGPPGTGKTTTVVGILSGLFAKNDSIKVLVCAQSNAAVDEIASTVLKNGIFDLNENKRDDISLLRIGEKRQKHEIGIGEDVKTAKEIERSIHSIKLNVLVEEKLANEGIYDPNLEIKKAIESIDEKEKKLEELQKRGKYDLIQIVESEIKELSFEVKNLKIKRVQYFAKKNEYKDEFVRKSDVIFCTLSGSGSMIVMKNIESIDHLIIDEACQSLELSTLIPFHYNPKSVILIGDPKQLPATTFSEVSKTNNYDRSFFERMMKCNTRPIILSQQYRMIKEISDFTSKIFYKKKIKCDQSVIDREIPKFVNPVGSWFFGIENSEEKKAEDCISYYNENEADFVFKLYTILRKRTYNTNAHIGIISPYKGQVNYIEGLLYQNFGHSWKKNCEVSSVDGFQGREVDIVILSTVRSENIGFLRDERRMNVAISRAKFGMYAVGNEACLSNNPKWRRLIDYCKQLNKFVTCSCFEEVRTIFNKQTQN